MIGADGLLLHASSEWGAILDGPISAAIGRPLLDPPLVASIGATGCRSFSEHLEALRAGRRGDPIEFGCEHPEGTERFYEGRAYEAWDEPGVLVLLHDTTARWQRLVALAERERRFGTVADASHDIVTETDFATGRFTYVSGAAQSVLGYSPEELVETPALRLHHPDGSDEFLETVRNGIAAGAPFHVPPHRLRRRDGSWVWVEATGIRYYRPDGGERLIGVSRDITAKVESEETRKALEARLRRSQRLESLGVLAGGIAHDFNNLLTPIVGAVDLLKQDLPADSPLRRQVETVRAAADHGRVLTDQMLAFAGETALEYKIVDLDEIVERMSRLLETMATPTATLVYLHGENLSPIRADAGQIGQVVVNLVTNASEALPPEGGRVEIRTNMVEADRTLLDQCYLGESLEEGRYVVLEVEDEGEGIADSTLDRILDPFFTTKFTGRGLGLAVVLGIVRRHDGCLRIESQPGRGTVFRILLPASSEGTRSTREREASSDVDRSADGGTLLIVDDDEGARELTAILLERAGFTVHTASSGRIALEIFSSQRDEIDGVILDGTMPEMTGASVFDAIRQIDPAARVLLMSGYTRERDAEALFERGLVSFLHKPFDAEQLLGEVRDLLAEPASDPDGSRD